MDKIRKVVLFSIFFSFGASGDQVCRDVTIKDVLLNLGSGIYFRINESMNYNESCGSNNWFKVESGTKYEKEAFSILLTYEAQAKPITFSLSGCTGGYPKLFYIY